VLADDIEEEQSISSFSSEAINTIRMQNYYMKCGSDAHVKVKM